MLNLDCVPISTYCKETGETPEAINKRVQRGVWREGVQVLKVEGVKEEVDDLSEVAKWARQNCSNYRAACNNQKYRRGETINITFYLQRVKCREPLSNLK